LSEELENYNFISYRSDHNFILLSIYTRFYYLIRLLFDSHPD